MSSSCRIETRPDANAPAIAPPLPATHLDPLHTLPRRVSERRHRLVHRPLLRAARHRRAPLAAPVGLLRRPSPTFAAAVVQHEGTPRRRSARADVGASIADSCGGGVGAALVVVGRLARGGALQRWLER
jgi:hypothetical protein